MNFCFTAKYLIKKATVQSGGKKIERHLLVFTITTLKLFSIQQLQLVKRKKTLWKPKLINELLQKNGVASRW